MILQKLAEGFCLSASYLIRMKWYLNKGLKNAHRERLTKIGVMTINNPTGFPVGFICLATAMLILFPAATGARIITPNLFPGLKIYNLCFGRTHGMGYRW
jgi:hypothetical protein